MSFQNTKTYTTTAIILNRKDYSEADRLFVFYSPEYGKIEAVATSAKKASSKMAKFLEPLMEVELLLVRGRTFTRIAEVKLIDNFEKLKAERQKWLIGCYCLEVIDKLTKTESAQEEVFVLLKDILNILKESDNNSLLSFYIWQLLAKLGYRPHLDGCVSCKENVGAPLVGAFNGEHYAYHEGTHKGSPYSFNPAKGGIECVNCNQTDKNSIKISQDTLNILQIALQQKLHNLKNIDIEDQTNKEIGVVVDSLLSYNLDYGLNTMKFFRKY